MCSNLIGWDWIQIIIIITKILKPTPLRNLNIAISQTNPILIYSIEDIVNRKTANIELPDYESGDVVPGKSITYEGWENSGDHQP